MLINAKDIVERVKAVPVGDADAAPEPISITGDVPLPDFIDDKENILTRTIGELQPNRAIHFYSYGNFNLVRLIVHLMKQTGPVNLFMTSYSFSQKSIEQLLHQQQTGKLLSIKVIVDNRVRTMSPKPFHMLSTVFDYRCSSIHAKVALLWNDKWKISVVTSQNATDNPKMERGTIFTEETIFNFDYKALTNEFNRGTT